MRLRNAYVITCKSFSTDQDGNVTEIRAHYHPETLGGKKPEDGRKVKGIIHWVNAGCAIDAEVRLYDRLFQADNPAASEELIDSLNPNSLRVIHHAKCEPSLEHAEIGERFQFTRLGYFIRTIAQTDEQSLVFNRITELRQTWK